MLWLKALHIAGLTVWCAGLLYLPGLLLAHWKTHDPQDFGRVRMAARFVYMGIISPAAFLAVGAGSVLVLISDALHPWMYLKLIAVGVLVIVHMQFGHWLAHLADAEAQVPRLRIKMLIGVALLAMLTILVLVLWKPDLQLDLFPAWLTEPGLLNHPKL